MRQRARIAGIGVFAGILGMLAVNFAAFHVGPFERLDADVYDQFVGLQWRPHVHHVATAIANLCDPFPYVYLCAIPVIVALSRGRRMLALTIVAVILGADFCTELVKHSLHQHRTVALINSAVIRPNQNSWPSGHTTAAMSLALCLVLASAPRWRPWAALAGATFTLGVIYSLLTLGWHYVSDVLGGLLMAGTWTFFGVCAMSLVQARKGEGASTGELRGRLTRRSRPGPDPDLLRALAPIVGASAAAVALAVAVVFARPGSVLPFARGHERLIAGVLVIATLALSLAGSLVVVLRRAPRSQR